MTAAADKAAKHWNARVKRLISHRENAVYEIVLSDGRQAALRQHRPGYQQVSGIEEELAWSKVLASEDFPCPAPLETLDGRTIAIEQGHVFSAVTWVHGVPIAHQDHSSSERENLFSTLGRLLAKLHTITDEHAVKAPNRPNWSIEGLVGPDPLWGRFWQTPPVGSKAEVLLTNARVKARDWLSTLTEQDVGLIHADAIGENVLGTVDDLWLIDFDDSGTGFRNFDLGVALTQHWDQPYLPSIAEALVSGYEERNNVDVKTVLKFMSLRCLASAGWVQGRLAHDDPRRDKYVQRAVTCAEQYLF